MGMTMIGQWFSAINDELIRCLTALKRNDKQIGITLWSLIQLIFFLFFLNNIKTSSAIDSRGSCCLPATTTVQSRPVLPNELQS